MQTACMPPTGAGCPLVASGQLLQRPCIRQLQQTAIQQGHSCRSGRSQRPRLSSHRCKVGGGPLHHRSMFLQRRCHNMRTHFCSAAIGSWVTGRRQMWHLVGDQSPRRPPRGSGPEPWRSARSLRRSRRHSHLLHTRLARNRPRCVPRRRLWRAEMLSARAGIRLSCRAARNGCRSRAGVGASRRHRQGTRFPSTPCQVGVLLAWNAPGRTSGGCRSCPPSNT